VREAISQDLLSGKVKSCGCIWRQIRHGHAIQKHFTLTYSTWYNMKSRCKNPHTPMYNHYGGRGISVCERWQNFDNFLADMGERPAGTTIERINNDKGYEPGNCRWATMKEQSHNQRDNNLLTFKDQTFCLTEWAEKLSISPQTLRKRVSILKWSIERAFTEKINIKFRSRGNKKIKERRKPC